MPYTQYRKTDDTDEGPSPAIWSQIKTQNIIEDPSVGIHFFDDFTDFRNMAAGETEAFGGKNYGTFVKTGCSMNRLPTERPGGIRLAQDGTTDDEIIIVSGNNVDSIGNITLADGKRSAFEARFKAGDVTSAQSWFLGVAEHVGMAAEAALLPNGSAAINDEDQIGFRVVDGDPDGIDIVYRKNSAGGEVVVLEEAQVAVAGTWYKLGWFWDGYQIFFYVDGTFKAKVNVNGLSVGDLANFPNTDPYALVLATKSGGAAMNFDMGFWRYAQEF